MTIEKFWSHVKVTHPVLPIIFSILLNKSQLAEKIKMKNFLSNIQIKYPYRRLYGESVLKGAENTSICQFKCGAIGESVKCPSFYKFEKLGRGLTWPITFSIVHNHHKAQRTSLSMKGKVMSKIYWYANLKKLET